MNILLVTPINRSYVIIPSLGLGYLASVAQREGFSVQILDCIKERTTFAAFGDFVRENHFDVIGFQVFSYDLNSVKRHIALIRQYSPRSITVAGGAHPSGAPEGIMDFIPDLDYAFRGEAEIGFPLFVSRLADRCRDFPDVPGLIYRSEGTVRVNPPRVVDDLDALPLPSWDLLKPETYPEAPHGAFSKQFPTAPIIVTRGCPCACTFCAGKSITGPVIRKRSIDNVLEELRYLRKRGIREFHIEDENFTADRNLVHAFCERLLRDGITMSWSLPSGVRIDSLEREMLVIMERAGCYSMALGIEFGSQRLMDITRKNITIDTVRENMRLFRGLKIKTTGFFLLGIPGETLEEMRETVRFALDLPIDRAQFNNFIPLPGSQLWAQLSEQNRLRNIRWDRFFVHDIAYTDEHLSARDIKTIQRIAYVRFYARPKIILKLARELRSARHLLFLLKRFWDAMMTNKGVSR